MNLHQIVNKPTRLNNKLDLIILNQISQVLSQQVDPPFLSDHSLTECIVKIKKPKPESTTKTFRDYKKCNP